MFEQMVHRRLLVKPRLRNNLFSLHDLSPCSACNASARQRHPRIARFVSAPENSEYFFYFRKYAWSNTSWLRNERMIKWNGRRRDDKDQTVKIWLLLTKILLKSEWSFETDGRSNDRILLLISKRTVEFMTIDWSGRWKLKDQTKERNRNCLLTETNMLLKYFICILWFGARRSKYLVAPHVSNQARTSNDFNEICASFAYLWPHH